MTPRRCFMLSLTLPPLGMWPAVVSGQPLVRPHRISILSGGTAQGTANWDACYASMHAIGYEEGRDVVYDRRSADGDTGRLPQLARELLVDNPRLIVTTGGREALAAREATSRIPIVMIFGGVDPVGMGLAQSLARPGGNVTGMTLSVPGITEKRLALLCEAIPAARRIGVLENPGALGHSLYRQELEASAAKLGITLLPAAIARTPKELDVAFDVLRRQRPQALFVHSDVLFFVQRSRVVSLAAQARLPASYSFTEDVEAGGLMAYAVQFRDLYERAPVFIDKILKGSNPAEMPIEQPTRFGLWLNLRTANALGLVLPRTLLLLAERIVE